MRNRTARLGIFAFVTAAPVIAVTVSWWVFRSNGSSSASALNFSLRSLTAALLLALALYVRWCRADEAAARALSVLSSVLALALVTPLEDADMIFSGVRLMAQLGLGAAVVTICLGVPAALLHLAMVFPSSIALARRRWTFPVVWITPLLGFVAIVRGSPDPGWSPFMVIALLCLGTSIFGYLLATPVVIIQQYRRSTFETKRQIRWPVFATVIAVVLSIVVPSVLNSRISPSGSEVNIGLEPAFLALIPIAFAIAIFKYHLLDIDVIIRKTITYTIVTFLLVLLYAGGVAAVSGILVANGISNETVRLVTTAIVAALFVPVRDRVQRRIDTRFYRRKYDDIESVRLLDEGIAAATDLQSLLSEATARLQRIFVCRAAAILVREPRSSTLTISSSIGLYEEAIRSAQLAEDSSATRSICNLDLHPYQSPDAEAVRAMRARLLVPVRGQGGLIAVIALGAKTSDEIYDARDERVAAALADRLAGAIENYRFRQLTAAESEWRTLDRISRLVFVAIAQQSGEATTYRAVADVRIAADAAGLHTGDERIETAMARLVDYGAIERSTDGGVVVTRRNWLALPDVLRPLELVARDAGQRVGAYELLDRIGRGGMGEVYRATNVHDGSFAAVKILPPPGGRGDERKRFEREGALVAALSHPNIVRVLERGEYDGRLYIAMELIDGNTLAAVLDGSEWSVDRAVHVALQIASALSELHSLGVVHRDVKSSNVMLTRSGRAVLLDFGLARSGDASSLTAEAHIMGSLPYMAPEQFGGAVCDARTDVWSFGVVLYESLTGRRPWLSSSPTALIAEIGSGVSDWSRLDSLVGIAPVTTIIRESLQVDPGLRIRDGAELLRRLTHAAQLTTSSGRRVTVPERHAQPEALTLTSPARLREGEGNA